MRNRLRNKLLELLIGDLTLKNFQEWLLASLQKILDSNDSVTVDIANEMDANLIAVGEGLLDFNTLLRSVEASISKLETQLLETQLIVDSDASNVERSSTCAVSRIFEYVGHQRTITFSFTA